jgi:DNA processing protein
MDEAEAKAWYILACAQLGARATLRLLEAYQHPAAILAATPKSWTEQARVTASGCQRLQQAANRDIRGELERLARLGITMITLFDPCYPARLRAISDPPCLLFVKGTLPTPEQPAIAIVGSRSASPYGRHVAAELAAGLARRGLLVVSGMALGADAAAHEGCLRAGGRTIAVLGSGIDVVYPAEHGDLYERIAAQGAVISEAPPGAPPTRSSFPVRNRIISGLSLGVVVVEASEKSGALITADHALEQGREVFAVPGSVNSAQSRGSHRLLRDGAKLVESVDDILEDLPVAATPMRQVQALSGPNWDLTAPTINAEAPPAAPPRQRPPSSPRPGKTPPPPAVAAPPPPTLPPEEDTLLRLLSNTARHVDDLIADAQLPPAQVNAALLMLELKGYVQRRPGNQYVRLR